MSVEGKGDTWRKSQAVVRDGRGQPQPADKKRTQQVNAVEETENVERAVQETAEKSGF